MVKDVPGLRMRRRPGHCKIGGEDPMTLQQMKYAVTIADCGSINEAAKRLFISQPSLSGTIRELENELDMTLFLRSNRGITITADGDEFLGYARLILEQYELIENKFIAPEKRKKKFSVSMQHYTFAVEAFIRVAKKHRGEPYAFAVHETRTAQVIDNVRNLKSEVGVLYLNEFNAKVLTKIFRDDELEFIPLFRCPISVYLWKDHPLAEQDTISFADLGPYPCLSFEQGDNNSFHFAEEVLATRDYDQIIKADDRATMLNLMVGLNAYTLCSGIICEDLNGEYYRAVPLDTDDRMTIGYIKKKRMPLSTLAEEYIGELQSFRPKE